MTHFSTFLKNLTSSNLTYNINLLKIDFEINNNLGGENTHLGSKLEDPILGFGGWILMFKNPKSVPPFAATLKTEANQPKLVSSSPWVPSCRRNHAQPPSGVVVVVVVVVVWGWGSQNPNPWTAASHLISPSLFAGATNGWPAVSPSPPCPSSRHLAVEPRRHPLARPISLYHTVFGSRLSQRGGNGDRPSPTATPPPPFSLPVILSFSLFGWWSHGGRHPRSPPPCRGFWLKKGALAPPLFFVFPPFFLTQMTSFN